MIPRYQLPEMAAVFTDEARFGRYLEIELLAVEAWAELGVVPAGAADGCRRRAPVVDAAFVAAVAERERVTNHDVAAFVDVAQAAIGDPDGAWLHYGLTSSDVVDTAWCSMLRDAVALLVDAGTALFAVLHELAHRHRATVCIGRTHGMHAEPTTFGTKCALWALQVARDLERLHHAGRAVAVGKLSGAVGTYATIDPRVEARVCAALGLAPTPATQVVARDRHAQFLYACAAVGTTVETVAVELRHLQRTEVAEVEEGFGAGQKGSSAMPHKRNPISAETLSGLARVLRGNLVAGLEDVALWHERDISHSSVERLVLPDSAQLAYYVLRRAARLLSGLRVDTDRMRANVGLTGGAVFSQPVLLALVAAGLGRDEAYRIVQEDARRALDAGRPLREVLAEDDRVGLDDVALDAAFDPDRVVATVAPTFTALDAAASRVLPAA
jgi:adenylosuccinate lyase